MTHSREDKGMKAKTCSLALILLAGACAPADISTRSCRDPGLIGAPPCAVGVYGALPGEAAPLRVADAGGVGPGSPPDIGDTEETDPEDGGGTQETDPNDGSTETGEDGVTESDGGGGRGGGRGGASSQGCASSGAQAAGC
jgi:hypothetical protein